MIFTASVFGFYFFFASANEANCNLPTLIALASHYFAACVFCPQMFRCGQLWSLFMFSQHIVSSCWGIVWWLQRSAWFDLLCSRVHPSWGFTFVKRCVGSSEAISHELNLSQINLMSSINSKYRLRSSQARILFYAHTDRWTNSIQGSQACSCCFQ